MGRKHTHKLEINVIVLFLFGAPARRLVEVYSITVGFSPVLYCWLNVTTIGEPV